MKKRFKILCLQTKSSKDPYKNIIMLEGLFKKLTTKVDLICLPECVAVFSDEKKDINLFLKKFKDPFFNLIKQQAIKKRCCIQIGSIPEKYDQNKFVNRSYVIDENGNIDSFYDKINLFDVKLNDYEHYYESNNYVSGKKTVVSNLSIGKLGLSVCYDLRFPKLYKKLAKKGADFFSIPAAFTYTTGKAHWHTLVRARAIENGCFVFASAQNGMHDNGRKTFGHSMIVNPWGKVLAEAKSNDKFIISEINLDEVNLVRRKIPSMTNY